MEALELKSRMFWHKYFFFFFFTEDGFMFYWWWINLYLLGQRKETKIWYFVFRTPSNSEMMTVKFGLHFYVLIFLDIYCNFAYQFKRIFMCFLLRHLSSLSPPDNLSVQNDSGNEHLFLKDYWATGVNDPFYVSSPWKCPTSP